MACHVMSHHLPPPREESSLQVMFFKDGARLNLVMYATRFCENCHCPAGIGWIESLFWFPIWGPT